MLNHQFSKDRWIFPEYLYSREGKFISATESNEEGEVKFKNSGLRVYMDPEKPLWADWRSGVVTLFGRSINIVSPEGIEGSIEIGIRNLLSILVEYPPENGCLQGTFKLTVISDRGFELVPEDTKEAEFKDRITEIWNDPGKPFTTKMIPGHLYIGKAKNLFICIEPEVDIYTTYSPPYGLGYYWSLLYRYSDSIPRKAKLLLGVYDSGDAMKGMRSGQYKSLQDLTVGTIDDAIVYSPRYAGKDLGPVLTDDGRRLEDLLDLISEEKLERTMVSLGLIGRNHDKSERLKQMLIDYFNENNYRTNNELSKLYRRLGI